MIYPLIVIYKVSNIFLVMKQNKCRRKIMYATYQGISAIENRLSSFMANHKKV